MEGYWINEDGEKEPCQVYRRGPKRTRIEVKDKLSFLVPSDQVEVVEMKSEPRQNDPKRIVPLTPLQRLYSLSRDDKGSSEEKFRALRDRFDGRHGCEGAVFLKELFERSFNAADRYANEDEAFYDKDRREPSKVLFARKVIDLLENGQEVEAFGTRCRYIDREIAPFRTTKSCKETGKGAASSGGGGMDTLLRSDDGSPVIAEVKAASESVGPTFALVQALMYGSQLATESQFRRLKRHYREFSTLIDADPAISVVILLEDGPACSGEDFDNCCSLLKELRSDHRPERLKGIEVFRCAIEEERLFASPLCTGT